MTRMTLILSLSALPFVFADEAVERLTQAKTVFEEVMATPDKGIPRDLLAKAHCVVIVPSLKKGGFIVGAPASVVLNSGTDSDFVVKLIDVYPQSAQPNAWAAAIGPAPGEYAKSLNGYQLPIAMEVRRGRYNASYEHPQPLKANEVTEFKIPLRSHDHVFLKTVDGLRPVHAILRRLDDDYCDPLELRPDSTLGVPGLVAAWRAGHVLVANAFGTGVLESRLLSSALPAICARLQALGDEDLAPGRLRRGV